MKFQKRLVKFIKIVDVDVFTQEEVNERTIFYPVSGGFEQRFHRDQIKRALIVDSWEERWLSKVITGDFVSINRHIKQLSMETRARAYPGARDGYYTRNGIFRASLVFSKTEQDISLIKLATV